MTTIDVSNIEPFGVISNQMVRTIYAINQSVKRLNAAQANAASGFTGTAGTEYEGIPFGVSANANSPGAQGAAWAFAVANLATAWNTFISSAQASINALDNG